MILHKIAMHEKSFLNAFPLTIFVKQNRVKLIKDKHESIFNAFKSTYFKLIVQNFNSSSAKTASLILILK